MKIIVMQLNLQLSDEEFTALHRKWWYNRRNKNKGGLRLTDDGLAMIIDQLQLESIDVNFETPITLTPRILITLDQHLTTPYYLNSTTITLFSEKTRTELFLFNDDLERLGVILSNKQK